MLEFNQISSQYGIYMYHLHWHKCKHRMPFCLTICKLFISGPCDQNTNYTEECCVCEMIYPVGTVKPFSHDKKKHSLQNFLNVCEILQTELRVKGQ